MNCCASQLIERAADLSDTDPIAAQRLWARAAPLELVAADRAADENARLPKLLSAATCLLESRQPALCMIVLERMLQYKLEPLLLEEVAALIEEAVDCREFGDPFATPVGPN